MTAPAAASPSGTTSAREAGPAPGPTRPGPEAEPLNEREDPERVLRFYADALEARDWEAAARAWGSSTGVSAATLRAQFGRSGAVTLDIGKGRREGAAGTLYYEAPVTVRIGEDGPPRRGTITLRRVNDVPGASADQLRWHIARARFD